MSTSASLSACLSYVCLLHQPLNHKKLRSQKLRFSNSPNYVRVTTTPLSDRRGSAPGLQTLNLRHIETSPGCPHSGVVAEVA